MYVWFGLVSRISPYGFKVHKVHPLVSGLLQARFDIDQTLAFNIPSTLRSFELRPTCYANFLGGPALLVQVWIHGTRVDMWSLAKGVSKGNQSNRLGKPTGLPPPVAWGVGGWFGNAQALSELRASGVIGDAGVSNFRVEQMQELQSLSLSFSS